MAKATTTPDFFWAQDGDHLYIKIGAVTPTDIKTKITEDKFYWFGESNGHAFEVSFNFRFPVLPKETREKVTRYAEYVLKKETSHACWPHMLTKIQKKILKNRCKVDWDKWIDEEDIMDNNTNFSNLNFEEFKKMGKKKEETKNDKEEKDSDEEPLPEIDEITKKYLGF